ncbi:ATPase [candidate division SR1 bacterium]|nr:ATPase [candidate division SR1 bacterium]
MKEIYNHLKVKQAELLKSFDNDFQRDIVDKISRKEKSIGLIGERGVGKTTIMLQRIKKTGGFYFSLDDARFAGTEPATLLKFVEYLYFELDIRMIYIDEVHKYNNWRQEIKNIYDGLPKMQVVFSSSSSLSMYQGLADLARRTDFYTIYPLNYKEYLKLFRNIEIPDFTIEEIIKNHEKISLEYASALRQTDFEDFIKRGQYPYARKVKDELYIMKIQNLFDKVVFDDLPMFINLQTDSLDKIRRLLYFISHTSPSELTFAGLATKIGINKNLVENVLTLLHKIGIITLIPKFGNLSDRVRKEYKMFLGNTNLYNAYNLETDAGILRECFVASQLKRLRNAELFSPKQGDIILQIFDKVWNFEIGGKSKKAGKYDENVYIVKDGIELSEDERTIPLWLMGLIKG